MANRVVVLNEVTLDPPGDWQLFFQRCRYVLEDAIQDGYRFIWKRPDGSLQAARGQARIPGVRRAKELLDAADKAGWAGFELGSDDIFTR